MPDISLPEIKLPDIKLPDGLRDMNRHDIQAAIGDRIPRRVELPDVDLSRVELPKAVEARLSQIEKAVRNVELPKAVEDRLPGRKRRNPILPVAAFLTVASMIAAAWWLITSPGATMRVRTTADRIRLRLTGQQTAVVPYDDDSDLGSLLPDADQTRSSVEGDTWPDTFSDLGDTVAAGNGSTTERPLGA